jgi:hypothetical protein
MTSPPQAEPPWEWVTLTEAARLVVERGYAPSMTRQRLARLAETDPAWPIPKERMRTVGPAKLVPWPAIESYFRARDSRPGPKGWSTTRDDEDSADAS